MSAYVPPDETPTLTAAGFSSIRWFFHPIAAQLQHFGCLQTHSSLRLLQKLVSYHPDIGQRKQSDELRSVFLQPTVAHLGQAKLAFDNPERMLHLGPNTGHEFSACSASAPHGVCFCALRLPGRMAMCQSTPVASGRLAAP